MIGEGLFSGFLALFWLAEFAFAGVVVYWFVTQGFSETERGEPAAVHDLESRASVRRSLAMWAGFFVVLVVLIVVGA